MPGLDKIPQVLSRSFLQLWELWGSSQCSWRSIRSAPGRGVSKVPLLSGTTILLCQDARDGQGIGKALQLPCFHCTALSPVAPRDMGPLLSVRNGASNKRGWREGGRYSAHSWCYAPTCSPLALQVLAWKAQPLQYPALTADLPSPTLSRGAVTPPGERPHRDS